MEDSTAQATSSRSRSERLREMHQPEEASSKMSSRKVTKAGAIPTFPALGHPMEESVEGDLETKSPAPNIVEDEADVVMTDTKTAPAMSLQLMGTTTAGHVETSTTAIRASTESSRLDTANTSQRTRSSTTIPASLPSAQSMPTTTVPPSASRLTSPLRIATDPGTTPSESPDTRLTASYSALTTPDTTSSTALKASNEIRRPGSPVGNQRVNLHKRRASASPHKFSGTRIAPIKDPNNLDELPSDSRTNTVGNDSDIAIYFDSNGALQIKQPPTDEHAMDEALAQPSMMTNMEHSNGSHQHPQSKRSAARRKRPFSLLEAIVRDNSLLLILTSYLHVPSIISLYAISKSFHLSFNRHATAFILSSMRTWAPDADKIFPWRCYLSLCIKDPIRRTRSIPKKFQEKIGSMGDISRDVPSLRWLQMVVWRQAIVTDMIIELKSKALWPPPGTLEAVKKMWFALDLPLNSHRLALFRSKAYMPDKIIRLATHFFIKCDMAFTDPGFDAVPPHPPNQAGIFPNQLGHGALLGCNLREKLSSDRDLTPLWRVLKGWSWDPDVPPRPMVLHDILKLNVRHKHKWPPGTPDHTLKKPIMGMRYSDFRFVGCERTFQLSDNEDQKLQRPLRPLLRLDQLLVGEVVRREMDPPDYLDVVASGFMFVNSGLRVPVMTAEEHNRRQKTSTNVLRRQAFPMPRSRAVGIMRTISKKVKEAAWM